MKPLYKKTRTARQANPQLANPARYSTTLQKALHLTRQAMAQSAATSAALNTLASWQCWLTRGQTKH